MKSQVEDLITLAKRAFPLSVVLLSGCLGQRIDADGFHDHFLGNTTKQVMFRHKPETTLETALLEKFPIGTSKNFVANEFHKIDVPCNPQKPNLLLCSYTPYWRNIEQLWIFSWETKRRWMLFDLSFQFGDDEKLDGVTALIMEKAPPS